MINRQSIASAAIIFFSILILNQACAADTTITGKVVSIADGDTITVLDGSKNQHIIRVYGVDCPEGDQDFGNKAKKFTSSLVYWKTVQVILEDTDKYGRTVGIVVMDDGKTLNEELIKAGFAWVFERYCKKPVCSQWKRYEESARKSKVGLWSQPNPMPPWEYRHASRSSMMAPMPLMSTSQSAGTGVYHGNTRSQVFHAPGCKDYDCKNCTVILPDREAAIKAGYRPCGMCRP